MDDLIVTLTPLIEHLKTYIYYYIGGAIPVGIFIYFTRRWTVPLIFYTVEYAAYLAVMHLAINWLTRLTAWFKTNSSMKALREDGVPVDAVYWTTPQIRFWEWEVYDPHWIIYVEGVFMVVIFLIMLRFRPMKPQKFKPRYAADGTKKTSAGGKTDQLGRNKYREDFLKAEQETKRIEQLRKKK